MINGRPCNAAGMPPLLCRRRFPALASSVTSGTYAMVKADKKAFPARKKQSFSLLTKVSVASFFASYALPACGATRGLSDCPWTPSGPTLDDTFTCSGIKKFIFLVQRVEKWLPPLFRGGTFIQPAVARFCKELILQAKSTPHPAGSAGGYQRNSEGLRPLPRLSGFFDSLNQAIHLLCVPMKSSAFFSNPNHCLSDFFTQKEDFSSAIPGHAKSAGEGLGFSGALACAPCFRKEGNAF